MKPRIQEVIVVEGKHDTENLRKYYECDTIETNGTHLGKEILDQIRYAQKTRGVIVFTDPDSPGNRIRHAINQNIKGCKNAFVLKEDARTTKKVGIEHADYEVLSQALSNLLTYDDKTTDLLTMSDMVELGLSGNDDAGKRREIVARQYHIGLGTAKAMLRKLNSLHLTKEEIKEILE